MGCECARSVARLCKKFGSANDRSSIAPPLVRHATCKEPKSGIHGSTQRNPLSDRSSLRLDGVDLALEILQLLLHGGVLLGHLLVLGLPLVALLLESLDFPLEVSSLDVGLAKPEVGQRWSASDRRSLDGGGLPGLGVSLLLVGLAQSPVSFLGLFLEELEPSSQRFVLGSVLLALAGGGLELLDLRLEFLYLGL